MKKTIHFFYISILAFCTFSTANATMLINEVDYDQNGSDSAEFIELFNSGSNSINLNGYQLDLVNGTTGSIYESFDLTGYSLAAGGYFIICGSASMVMNCNFDAAKNSNLIQNGAPDGITLYHNNILIDALSYEGEMTGITEGLNGALADLAQVKNNPHIMSIGRLPNSPDTNNNAADFKSNCITPGTANLSGNGNCSTIITGTVPQPPVIWLLASGLIGMLLNTKRKKTAL